MDEHLYQAALPTQAGAAQSTNVANFIGALEPTAESVFPISLGSEWLVDDPIEVSLPSLTVNQHTI